MQEKADYITVKGFVNYIKSDPTPWYNACTNDGCNKKVTETMSNMFQCEKCNIEMPNCQRRYIMSATIVDDTGTAWFSFFNDTAEQLLQAKADELQMMKV